jgi:iron uptake system EfeUOB component EfeO/EfeM
MQKTTIKPKIKALLDKINTPFEKIDKVKQTFIKPQTEDEWQKFHKINEDGI